MKLGSGELPGTGKRAKCVQVSEADCLAAVQGISSEAPSGLLLQRLTFVHFLVPARIGFFCGLSLQDMTNLPKRLPDR
jgi:hypothetical protein